MNTLTKVIVIAGIVLAYGLGAIFVGYKLRKPEIVYVDKTRTVTDTLWLAPEVEVITKWLPAKHDTVTLTDTVIVQAALSAAIGADRVTFWATLRSDNQTYGDLFVAYYFPPFDKFNYEFRPEPLPVIQTTEYIVASKHWYENGWLKWGAGLATGFLISQSVKEK